jgi:hypothetical protein
MGCLVFCRPRTASKPLLSFFPSAPSDDVTGVSDTSPARRDEKKVYRLGFLAVYARSSMGLEAFGPKCIIIGDEDAIGVLLLPLPLFFFFFFSLFLFLGSN